MSDLFHFDRISLSEAAELAQAMWHIGGLSPQGVVDIATRALVGGSDGPALRQLAGVEDDTCEVERLLDRALLEMGLEPISQEEAMRRVARLVTSAIAKGAVDPYYGATWIWGKVWNVTHDKNLTPFVSLVCDHDDFPEERDRYTREIIEYAREYAESAQEEKSNG